MKKLVSLLLALMVVMSLAVPAFAAGESVIKITGKDSFGVETDGEYTETNLFGSFKNVMPGDTKEQEIIIKNRSWATDYVKVYLTAKPHGADNAPVYDKNKAAADGKREEVDNSDMEDFLRQLTLTIYDKNDKVVYEGPALNAPDKSIYLGSLRRNKELTFNAELEVPLSLNNTYANRIGEVDWVFTVEYRNDPSDSPKTGDYVIMGAVALMAVSAAGIAILFFLRKKRKQ